MIALALSLIAQAVAGDPTPPDLHATEPAAAEPLETSADALSARVEALEARTKDLEAQLAEAQKRKPLRIPHLTFDDDVKLRFGAYLDTGVFAVFGDGASYVRDAGKTEIARLQSFPFLIPFPNRAPPRPDDAAWVFFGDPWAASINSQGDPASLGLDRTNLPRFDPIASPGPSFAVHMLNASAVGTIGENALFEASLNIEPRQGALGSSGDVLDLDLAYLEWKPLADIDLSLFIGKMESTFGREYRRRKAPDRFGVTPSLIARYTIGTPTGVKARGSFFERVLSWNVAVTNGAMSTERFAHFYNEIDKNPLPTVSTRIAMETEIAEIGVSALAGPQDLQPAVDVIGWQAGVDARVELADFSATAEYIRAHEPGGGVDEAPFLSVDGAYLETSWQALMWLGLLARADVRRAVMIADPNLYVSDVARLTLGARFDIAFNVVAKLELIRVQELTGPEIPDDLFTSSLIFRF